MRTKKGEMIMVMTLTKANLKKLIENTIETKDRWFVDENESRRMRLSFRITPKIIQGTELLTMVEWKSIAPSGMLWNDDQGSQTVSVKFNGTAIKSMEDLIILIVDQVRPGRVLHNFKY